MLVSSAVRARTMQFRSFCVCVCDCPFRLSFFSRVLETSFDARENLSVVLHFVVVFGKGRAFYDLRREFVFVHRRVPKPHVASSCAEEVYYRVRFRIIRPVERQCEMEKIANNSKRCKLCFVRQKKF